jgi:hypothetical protein
VSWLSSLPPCFRDALLRRGALWPRLSGLLLITTIIVMGVALPVQAAPHAATLQMLASPEGGSPDKTPSAPAISEAEAEKPSSSSVLETDGGRPGGGFDTGLPSFAQLSAQAAASTTRRLAAIRGCDHPRDPRLRLNLGHAPPRG